MQLNDLKRNTKRRYGQSVGRGGKRGKTSGRGTKGQKARAGRKIRPEIRDVIMRLPKLRGYRFKSRFSASVPVNLVKIEKVFANGDTVSPETLLEKGVIAKRAGAMPEVKVLAEGELTKKVSVKGCAVSAGARAKIEKVGGSVAV
jgi:large subunit ribosomal protein L15